MSASADASTAPFDLPQFGPESIITFAHGLVGQPEWKRFFLLTSDDAAGLGVLQSVDDDQLALMVTNPRQVLPDYSVELSTADRSLLGLEANQQPMLLTTLSVHGTQITANLVGPLVINPRTRVAKQLVLPDSAYTARHPVASVATEN